METDSFTTSHIPLEHLPLLPSYPAVSETPSEENNRHEPNKPSVHNEDKDWKSNLTDNSPQIPDSTRSSSPSSVILHIIVSSSIFVTGIAMTIVVRPNLILVAAGDSQTAAYYNAFIMSLQALASVVLSPMLGNVSDKVGRKPVFFLSHFGECLALLIISLFPYSLSWQVLAYTFVALTAGYYTLARAIIADVSKDSQHLTANYGYLGGAAGICFLIGPAMAAIIERHYELGSLYGGCVLTFVAAFYVYFFVNETLPTLPTETERRPWRDTIHVLRKTNPNPIPRALEFLKQSVSMRWLALTYIASSFAAGGLESIIYFYVNQRLGWGPSQFGFFLSTIGFSSFVVEAGLARLIVNFFGERVALAGGHAISTLSMCLYAFAGSDSAFYFAFAVGALGFITDPAFKGILARQATPNRQGALQGSFSALTDVVGPFRPIFANVLFSIGVAVGFIGLPFLGLAIFSALSVIFAWAAFSTDDLL